MSEEWQLYLIIFVRTVSYIHYTPFCTVQVYVFWESCYTAPQYTPFDLLILSRMWPHLNEIMFRYISNSFISIKLKLTWQLSFLHVKKCLSYLHILLFYALTYYICKILSYHFFAWIQAFASMINVNAACKADYSHLCASIIAGILLCILGLQEWCD